MTAGPPNEITKLLMAWQGGDKSALNQLISLLYPELHQIASFHLRGEVQATPLYKVPPWFTKLTCAWWVAPSTIGRTGRISSESPRRSCGPCWWTVPALVRRKSGAGEP